MVDYIAQIEAELVHHRASIAKLENALEVVKRLAKKAEKPEAAKKVDKPEAPKPLFTVRKTTATAVVEKHDDLPTAAESRRIVLEFLAQQPMTSGNINDRMGNKAKYQKQRVYSTLNSLIVTGLVERDEAGVHRLAKTDAELQAEVPAEATTSQAA